MKSARNALPLTLGILWLALFVPGQISRVRGLIAAAPRAAVSQVERGDYESENVPFRRFLDEVASVTPARGTVLLLIETDMGQHNYYYYRACYELYPTRFMMVPVQGLRIPDVRVFRLASDARTVAAIERQKTGIAALHISRRGMEPESHVFRVKPVAGNLIQFEKTESAQPVPGEARVPPASRPLMWWMGLACAVGLGWLLNLASGLARGFGRDRAALAGMALFSGIGFLAFALFLLSLAGIPWTSPVLAAVIVVPGIGCLLVMRRRGTAAAAPAAAGEPVFSGAWHEYLGLGLIGFSFLSCLFHSGLPMGAWGNWDAWAIYDLKTKMLVDARGVSLGFLSDDLYKFTNQAYAIGFQIFQAWLAFWAGGVGTPELRLVSPVVHLAQVLVFSHLLADLGIGRMRWLLAGILSLVPTLLLYAINGYMDITVGAVMTAALALLVKAVRGRAPLWTVGWMCGVASSMKDEGLTFSMFTIAVLGLLAFLRKIRPRPLAVAILVLALVAGPWRFLTARLGVGHKDWNTSPAYIMSGMPGNAIMVGKSFLLEMFGHGPDMQNLKGVPDFSMRGWFLHLENSWGLLWYAVVAGLIIGARRLRDPAILAVLGVLGLQFGAHCLLYLTTIHDLAFHLVTSVDRRLLQFAPGLFAVAAGVWLGSDRKPEEK